MDSSALGPSADSGAGSESSADPWATKPLLIEGLLKPSAHPEAYSLMVERSKGLEALMKMLTTRRANEGTVRPLAGPEAYGLQTNAPTGCRLSMEQAVVTAEVKTLVCGGDRPS